MMESPRLSLAMECGGAIGTGSAQTLLGTLRHHYAMQPANWYTT